MLGSTDVLYVFITHLLPEVYDENFLVNCNQNLTYGSKDERRTE